MLLGLWELSSPYALNYQGGFHTETALILGAVIALAGFWAAAFHERWPYYVTGLGAVLVLVLPFAQPAAHVANDLLVGLLMLVMSAIALLPQLTHP